jgi:NADH dehydrogenase
MKKTSRILVLGGSGFIGTHVVSQLTARGLRVVVPTRHRERARHLIVLPTIDVIETRLSSAGALDDLISGCDAVINLVGVLQSQPGGLDDPFGAEFRRAHVDLPEAIVRACQRAGVRRFIHVSALGVSDDPAVRGPSRYLRSKAAGEAHIRQSVDLDWTILRPSVVFGADDAFLNLFASMQRRLPLVPLARPQAKFQPIWVEDLGRAIVNLIDNPITFGKTYDLVGPEVFTLRQLVGMAGTWSGHPRPIIGLPSGIDRLVAGIMEMAPAPPMTIDNLDSMSIDNVSNHPLSPELGISPSSLQTIGPAMFGGGNERRYGQWREQAHR